VVRSCEPSLAAGWCSGRGGLADANPLVHASRTDAKKNPGVNALRCACLLHAFHRLSSQGTPWLTTLARKLLRSGYKALEDPSPETRK
jgi:hypothetical protein